MEINLNGITREIVLASKLNMKSVNLVEAAKELQSHLEKVVRAHSQLPDQPREYLEATCKQLAVIVNRLQLISTNILNLTAVQTGEKDLQRNAQHWDSLPAGQIAGAQLEELVLKHSTTLRTLYQGAVDVKSITKFTEAELSVARELGDNFSIHKAGWVSLKAALARQDSHVLAKSGDAVAIRQFFTMLKQAILISGFKILSAKFQSRKQSWIEADLEKLRYLPQNHPIRIEFTGLNARIHSFLTGHWFNAYAYLVFEDQLKRLDSDFEIYPRVHYEYASAGRRTQGDFDVIINIGRRLLLVECKSGRMNQIEGRDDFAEIVRKVELIKQAFRSTRITGYNFILMYNPEANDPAIVREYFPVRGIEPVTPQEIRGVVIDRIRGNASSGMNAIKP